MIPCKHGNILIPDCFCFTVTVFCGKFIGYRKAVSAGIRLLRQKRQNDSKRKGCNEEGRTAKQTTAERAAMYGVLVALAMIFSYIETLIPIPMGSA